jgi:hypothetical protein
MGAASGRVHLALSAPRRVVAGTTLTFTLNPRRPLVGHDDLPLALDEVADAGKVMAQVSTMDSDVAS